MSAISETLRAEAAELEQAVTSIFQAGSPASAIRTKLVALLGEPTLERAKDRISEIISEMPTEAEEKRFLSLIVGMVVSQINRSLAMILDRQEWTAFSNGMQSKRTAQMKFNQELNMAVAKGDWDGFNAITERYYNSIVGPGDSAGQGDQPTPGVEG